MSKKIGLIAKILLPIVILALGGAVWKYFDATKPKANPRRRPFMGMLVEVKKLQKENRKIQIQTHGIVRAKERIILTPPIAGTIDYINPSLVEGGFIRAGEVLVGIEPAANINATYTEIEAPFNGIVQAMDASIDQYVSPGFAIATLIGSDEAQVKVDLPLREMARLPLQNLPNRFGIPAKVVFTYGNRTQTWDGIVQRNLPELTPKGGMAQLLIEIRDPFQLKANPNNSNPPIPLFIGAFVDVTIPAQIFNDVFIIPAHALRDQNTVYLEKQGELEIRPVEVTYVKKDEVFVSKGLQKGENLITSPLKGAANGLKIRVAGKGRPGGPRQQGGDPAKMTRKPGGQQGGDPAKMGRRPGGPGQQEGKRSFKKGKPPQNENS